MKAIIEFSLPKIFNKEDISEQEIFDWVAYNVGYRSEISCRNPLYDYEFEADYLDID